MRPRAASAAEQARREVAGIEAVAGCGAVDHLIYRLRRDLARELRRGQEAACLPQLDRDLGNAAPAQPLGAFGRVLHPEQRLLVVERRQGDVDAGEHLLERRARRLWVGPADGAIVAVERDPPAVLAHPIGDRDQRRALRRIEDRERDAGEVQQVVAFERFGDLLGARTPQHVAGGRGGAPVGEAALAARIGADRVQPRQAPRQARDQFGPDAFVPPHREHAIAIGIVSKRRDVVDPNVSLLGQAGEIHGRVQGVAAVGEVERAGAAVAQLDHALADARDADHGFLAQLTPRG